MKSTVEEIRERFDAEANLYTNLETGQVSAVDSALAMNLVAEAAAVATPHATHLLASGAWIGALAALAAMLLRPTAKMTDEHLILVHRALKDFSLAGTVIVALIVASGLVNSYMLVGPDHILTLPSTLYGQLLMAKLTLFGVMVALAGRLIFF